VQAFRPRAGSRHLVARLKGNGSKRPVLVMGHTDVVGVQKEKWSFDPFTHTQGRLYLRARRGG